MNLASIYSVPFWQSVYPDFEEHKEIFLDLIKKYRSENPTVYKSNVFGYQSPDTLQSVKKLRLFLTIFVIWDLKHPQI